MCTFGVSPIISLVGQSKFNASFLMGVTLLDVAMIPLVPGGLCLQIPVAPKPCIPIILPFLNTSTKLLINGMPAAHLMSKPICGMGGVLNAITSSSKVIA